MRHTGYSLYGLAVATVLATGGASVASPPVLRPTPTAPIGSLRVMPAPALTAAGTNVLRCRGGPVELMFVAVTPAAGADFYATFERGTKPAGEGLEPAQCAWLDRGMNADESSVVCQKVNTLNLGLTHFADSKFAPPDIWLVNGIYSSSAKWIGQVTSPEDYFEFNVKNDESQGNKCQRVMN